jgi:hypothetical protein
MRTLPLVLGLLVFVRSETTQPIPIPREYLPTLPPGTVGGRQPGESAGSLSARFPPLDLSWTASELIAASEELRATQKAVPFYMYDFADMPLATILAQFERCTAERHMGPYLYTAAYFALMLSQHRWRVSRPEDAAFIVIPVAIGLDEECTGQNSTIAARTLDLVYKSPLWAARRKDHVIAHNGVFASPSSTPALKDALWASYMVGKHNGASPSDPWLASLMLPDFDQAASMAINPTAPRNLTFWYGGQTHANMYHKGYVVRQYFRERAHTLFETDGLPQRY